jgi:hypothetical protein
VIGSKQQAESSKESGDSEFSLTNDQEKLFTFGVTPIGNRQ